MYLIIITDQLNLKSGNQEFEGSEQSTQNEMAVEVYQWQSAFLG